MPAKLYVAPTDDGLCVQIVGKGSMAESATVKQVCAQALACTPETHVTVDLTQCDYLDSTLLGCLISIHRLAGDRWSVVAPEDVRKKVLGPTRLDQLLPLTDTPPALTGEAVMIPVVPPGRGEQSQHVYECHNHLAQVEGPLQPVFARLAEQMKGELQKA